MPSTFTHGVVPASCIALTSATVKKIPRGQLLRLAAIGFFLGNSPDLDIIPGTIFASHFHEIHRNWGHNIFSMMVFTWIGTLLFKRFVDQAYRPKRIWLTSAILVLSHVLFDSLGQEGSDGLRHGVPLLWPVHSYEMISPISIFMSYTVHPDYPPLIAHIMSVSFWTRAVFVELLFTALFIPAWVFSYVFIRKLKGRGVEKAQELVESESELEPKKAAS